MSKVSSLEQLFVSQLKDLHSAETQLIKALPNMAIAATDPALKEGFTQHLDQTREHAQRLAQILSMLSEDTLGKHCAAMEGLIREGNEAIAEDASPVVKDASLIAAAQRVEHYEIAGYGTVCNFALQLGYADASQLLQTTLQEEGETNNKLSMISRRINAYTPLHATVDPEMGRYPDPEEPGSNTIETRNRNTLLTYLSDMSAAETFLTDVLKSQEDEPLLQNFPATLALLSRIRITSGTHGETIRILMQEMGGEGRGAFKQAVSSMTAVATGWASKMRTHTASKMLRDNYVTLNTQAMGYTMLHTTALALQSPEVASFALASLQDYTPLVMELNEQVIPVTVAELELTNGPVDTLAASSALNNTQEAWRVHPSSLKV